MASVRWLALQQTNSGTDGGKEASCKKHDSLRNAMKHPEGLRFDGRAIKINKSISCHDSAGLA